MNILEIDNLRGKLNKNVQHSFSPRQKFFYLFDYFETLLQNDEQIACSYLLEQVESYADHLRRLFSAGLNPSLIQKITQQTDELLKLSCLSDFHLKIKDAVSEFNRKYRPVKNALNGELELTDSSNVLYFPVLENDGNNDHLQFGFLETIKVEIKEAKVGTNFYISPGGREIEKLISEQIETSWNLSIEHLKKYVKRFNLHHDVFIHFNNKLGYYTGNSLGAALSLVFLKELLNHYNAPIIFSFSGRVAVTGGLDKDENILEVSEDILEKKVVTAFFSTVQTFVVADNEKQFALEKLNELKQNYPNRKLKTIGVEDLDDLLSRRNVVRIRKQKAIVRSAKFAARHWVSLTLLTLLIVVVYASRLYDFDDNPVIIINDKDWVYIQNKNGKELWQNKMAFNYKNDLMKGQPLLSKKLVDIDFDGTNEVILTFEDRAQFTPVKEPGRIVCYSNDKEEIWEYYFRDTIKSVEMTHSNLYLSFIIDTITYKDNRALLCFASNDLYPCAIYFLDLKSGTRIGPTLWHTGHLQSALVGDFNQDGEIELVCAGINNTYGRSVIFSIDLNKIGGQAPADGRRKFKELPFASFNEYLLLPKSDYTEYFNLPWNFMARGGLNFYKNPNIFYLYLFEGKIENLKGIQVRLDENLNVVLIDPSLEFEVARDTLIARGELSPPYTHTPEFIQSLYDQLRYWDGEKFVTGNEYHKIKAARDERLELPPINNVP